MHFHENSLNNVKIGKTINIHGMARASHQKFGGLPTKNRQIMP